MRESHGKLRYVYLISEYLCRCEKSEMTDEKSTIECAKRFVEKVDASIKLRLISKVWEQNKQAAPYVQAFYQLYSSTLVPATSIDQLVEALEEVAGDQIACNKMLGEAAYTADILAKKARDVRQKDFEHVKRAEPQVLVFTPNELRTINQSTRMN